MKMRTNFLAVALALATILFAPSTLSQSRITGTPFDDEYVLFVIDSSGSMRRYEWDRVTTTIRETLAAYPSLKGLQVLNDEGNDLFISYRNEWIPDTPTNRQWIIDELENWEAYSTSNPRRGILSALDRYYDPNKKIALYVLGDDFSAGAQAIDPLLQEIEARNPDGESGVPHVRINTVAFPIFYDVLGAGQFIPSTGADMARLMAALSQRSGGSFVALPSRHAAGTSSAAPEAAASPQADAGRVLILIDASANMREPDWQHAVASVERLLADVGAGEFFQVMLLNDAPRSVIATTDGEWLSDPQGSQRQQALASLRSLVPAGASDLGQIAAAVGGLAPAPDTIYLLAASDPELDPERFTTAAVAGPPIELLLFAAESNRQAVPYYWSLALASGGSLVAPAEDWP